MEITPENIILYTNRKITFSVFKKKYTLFFFNVKTQLTMCKGFCIESKKTIPNKINQIKITTNYLYKIKNNNKVRLGKITRKQILEKVS